MSSYRLHRTCRISRSGKPESRVRSWGASSTRRWDVAWGWTDRLSWSHSRWLAHLERPEVEVWIAHLDGVIAGYAELERQPEESVEIAYFGLLSQFMGKGIGGFLLSDTVQRAFRAGAQRVWLHTCSLDSPRAIKNYRARGFKLFKEETGLKNIPSTPHAEAGW